MRVSIVTGCLSLLLLAGCQQAPPSVKVVERPIITVALSTPAPAPEQIIEAEKEKPEPPRPIPGPARVSEQDNPPAAQPELPAEAPPEPKNDYPKARPRKASPHPALASLPLPQSQPPVTALPRYPQSRVPNPMPRLPRTYVPAPLPRVPRTYAPARPIPRIPRAPQVSAIPPAPSYPQRTRSGVYRSNGYQAQRSNQAYQRQVAWQNEHNRLQQQYMQSRADALNIKYNRGRTRFTRHSPEVAISAAAPPMPRTRPRAPWDRLGQAFDRSDRARAQLRNHQRTQYMPPMPTVPRPGPPMPYRPCP